MSQALTRTIRLRKEGRAEEARVILLELVAERPDDPQVQYQCVWVHDSLGREREAVPFYERAIAGGLSGRDLERAFVGLGSTYRSLGEYGRAVETLREGVARFPENRSMEVFLAMALYPTSGSTAKRRSRYCGPWRRPPRTGGSPPTRRPFCSMRGGWMRSGAENGR